MVLQYKLYHAFSYIALKLCVSPKKATEDDCSLLSKC